MSFAYHGNYCGPGWTAGKYMNARDAHINDFNVPAVDELDQICKDHDMDLFYSTGPRDDKMADRRFVYKISKANIPGIKDNVAAFAVWALGEGPKLRSDDDVTSQNTMPLTRLRVNKKQKTSEGEQPAALITDPERDGRNTDDNEEQWQAEERFAMSLEDRDSIRREVADDARADFTTPARPQRTEMEISPDGEPRISERGRQIAGSLSNLLSDEQGTSMEPTVSTAMVSRASGAGTSNTGVGSHEPKVKYNVHADATLFTNVRTAYLRATYYFSFNMLDQVTPVVLQFRLNNPRQIFPISLTRQDLASNQNTLRAKGLSNDMAHQNQQLRSIGSVALAKSTAINSGYLAPFPHTVVGDTAADTTNATTRFTSSGTISDANTRPAWRDWYEGIWQAMHVIETDYKMTFFSGHSMSNNTAGVDNCFTTATVFTTTDTVTQAVGTGQTTPTDARMRDILQWPYLQQHNISLRDPSSPTNQFYVINGTWKDSESGNGGTTMDEQQIKTWYPTGADYTPSWRVDKTVLAYAGELASNNRPCINLKLELQYKVQYRDPRADWLYPKSTAATLNTNLTNKATRQVLSQELVSYVAET